MMLRRPIAKTRERFTKPLSPTGVKEGETPIKTRLAYLGFQDMLGCEEMLRIHIKKAVIFLLVNTFYLPISLSCGFFYITIHFFCTYISSRTTGLFLVSFIPTCFVCTFANIRIFKVYVALLVLSLCVLSKYSTHSITQLNK